MSRPSKCNSGQGSAYSGDSEDILLSTCGRPDTGAWKSGLVCATAQCKEMQYSASASQHATMYTQSAALICQRHFSCAAPLGKLMDEGLWRVCSSFSHTLHLPKFSNNVWSSRVPGYGTGDVISRLSATDARRTFTLSNARPAHTQPDTCIMHTRQAAFTMLCLSVLQANGATLTMPEPSTCTAANIIAFFSPVTSHWLQFQPILEELLSRGHHVKVQGSDGVVLYVLRRYINTSTCVTCPYR